MVLAFTGAKATNVRVRFVQEFKANALKLRKLEALLLGEGATRKDVAVGVRDMNDKLVQSRALDGKTTHKNHFVNEALLLSYALVGKAKPPVDRESLGPKSLKLLADLEALNGGLLQMGMNYEQRKAACRKLVLRSTKVLEVAA